MGGGVEGEMETCTCTNMALNVAPFFLLLSSALPCCLLLVLLPLPPSLLHRTHCQLYSTDIVHVLSLYRSVTAAPQFTPAQHFAPFCCTLVSECVCVCVGGGGGSRVC